MRHRHHLFDLPATLQTARAFTCIGTLACLLLLGPAIPATVFDPADGVACAGTPGTFVDVTQGCGISITPTGDRSDWGHGAAFCDFDGDGDLDLYVVTGAGQANRLYENTGNSFYTEIGAAAGVADLANGRAVVWADYDNDGDADMFVSNYAGPDRLYRNNGSGTFTDVAVAAGLAYVGKCHSAAWADYDNDGHLDLFVCNYGTEILPNPNLLYQNNGDGTFDEVAGTAGVADPSMPALACAWIDYDNDNDVDLYIAYDKLKGNILYRNDGDGTFTDVSAASNTGIQFNAMGVAVADYDQNGHLDMYITNGPEGNELLHNNGDGTFTHKAITLGVAVNRIGWGTAFLDYDNDGDDDLYVVNWYPIDQAPQGKNVLFRNNGGTFTDVSSAVGVGDDYPSYAVTVGDYNNNGFPDMFVNNQGAPSTFYENVPTINHWLKIRTVGVASNRDGIGAKVRVVTGSRAQLKDIRSGSGYLSSLSPEVDFGLGASTSADTVEITWPSGIVDVFTNVTADQYVKADEGGSIYPVAVLVTSFAAHAVDAGVELVWTLFADEAVRGFRIYRAGGDIPGEVVLNGGRLIAPHARHYTDATAAPGVEYRYSLGVVTEDGSEVRSQTSTSIRYVYTLRLSQNYPNPFNPSTTIRFSLPEENRVALSIYDTQGKHVITLYEGVRGPGSHEAQWDGRDANGSLVSTGVYFYRLTAEGRQVLTKKMLLLK
jgi:hypothetical protein